MGFSGKKWELIGDRGIYRNYGRYTLSWAYLRVISSNPALDTGTYNGSSVMLHTG